MSITVSISIPDPPPIAARREQQERFFGAEVHPKGAVLTPIQAVYDAVPADEHLVGGWWPTKKWREILVCATPQASAVLDATCALSPTVPITFVGLAGSLRDHAVGDVVEPSVVMLGDAPYAARRASSCPYTSARAVTVSCLNDSEQRRDDLVRRAEVVDMEAGWVCAVRRPAGAVRVVLVVSDEVYGRTFVESKLTDLKKTIAATATAAAEELWMVVG